MQRGRRRKKRRVEETEKWIDHSIYWSVAVDRSTTNCDLLLSGHCKFSFLTWMGLVIWSVSLVPLPCLGLWIYLGLGWRAWIKKVSQSVVFIHRIVIGNDGGYYVEPRKVTRRLVLNIDLWAADFSTALLILPVQRVSSKRVEALFAFAIGNCKSIRSQESQVSWGVNGSCGLSNMEWEDVSVKNGTVRIVYGWSF